MSGGPRAAPSIWSCSIWSAGHGRLTRCVGVSANARPITHLKIIVVSGRGDQNDLAEALPRGADDYIPKPFEPRQLLAKVGHALRMKDAQDASTC